MKTTTRDDIVKLIEKNGKMRPHDLHKALKISPQALHRHLKNLVNQELLEAKGSPPFTEYSLLGQPDFKTAASWVNAEHPLSNSEFVCETRDIFTGRLPRLKEFMKEGLSPQLLPSVIATAGEIGNNSFDHNMAQSRDVPGCWFESQWSSKQLWVLIADRGQGIFQSLVKVHPNLKYEQTALRAAFENIISGRAPERRGNGLKFVKNTISSIPGCGIACVTGGASVYYGEKGNQCEAILKQYFNVVLGTATLMVWKSI